MSDFYRSRFIDLDGCARILAETTQARSILEIGCGDGQLAQRLLEWFPSAIYQGIDVAPEVGRLFRGDPGRATFRSINSRSFLDEARREFELVVLVDVLHHVPLPARSGVIEDARNSTGLGGHYVVKDWLRSRTLAHAAVWASDRILTGDAVAYFEQQELGSLVSAAYPEDRCLLETTVPPHSNNVLLVYQRA